DAHAGCPWPTNRYALSATMPFAPTGPNDWARSKPTVVHRVAVPSRRRHSSRRRRSRRIPLRRISLRLLPLLDDHLLIVRDRAGHGAQIAWLPRQQAFGDSD